LAPEYPEPHYLLGKIYHRLGDDSLSKTEIRRFQALKKTSEVQAAPMAPQRQMYRSRVKLIFAALLC